MGNSCPGLSIGPRDCTRRCHPSPRRETLDAGTARAVDGVARAARRWLPQISVHDAECRLSPWLYGSALGSVARYPIVVVGPRPTRVPSEVLEMEVVVGGVKDHVPHGLAREAACVVIDVLVDPRLLTGARRDGLLLM